jgi:hypothetical protein
VEKTDKTGETKDSDKKEKKEKKEKKPIEKAPEPIIEEALEEKVDIFDVKMLQELDN